MGYEICLALHVKVRPPRTKKERLAFEAKPPEEPPCEALVGCEAARVVTLARARLRMRVPCAIAVPLSLFDRVLELKRVRRRHRLPAHADLGRKKKDLGRRRKKTRHVPLFTAPPRLRRLNTAAECLEGVGVGGRCGDRSRLALAGALASARSAISEVDWSGALGLRRELALFLRESGGCAQVRGSSECGDVGKAAVSRIVVCRTVAEVVAAIQAVWASALLDEPLPEPTRLGLDVLRSEDSPCSALVLMAAGAESEAVAVLEAPAPSSARDAARSSPRSPRSPRSVRVSGFARLRQRGHAVRMAVILQEHVAAVRAWGEVSTAGESSRHSMPAGGLCVVRCSSTRASSPARSDEYVVEVADGCAHPTFLCDTVAVRARAARRGLWRAPRSSLDRGRCVADVVERARALSRAEHCELVRAADAAADALGWKHHGALVEFAFARRRCKKKTRWHSSGGREELFAVSLRPKRCEEEEEPAGGRDLSGDDQGARRRESSGTEFARRVDAPEEDDEIIETLKNTMHEESAREEDEDCAKRCRDLEEEEDAPVRWRADSRASWRRVARSGVEAPCERVSAELCAREGLTAALRRYGALSCEDCAAVSLNGVRFERVVDSSGLLLRAGNGAAERAAVEEDAARWLQSERSRRVAEVAQLLRVDCALLANAPLARFARECTEALRTALAASDASRACWLACAGLCCAHLATATKSNDGLLCCPADALQLALCVDDTPRSQLTVAFLVLEHRNRRRRPCEQTCEETTEQPPVLLPDGEEQLLMAAGSEETLLANPDSEETPC